MSLFCMSLALWLGLPWLCARSCIMAYALCCVRIAAGMEGLFWHKCGCEIIKCYEGLQSSAEAMSLIRWHSHSHQGYPLEDQGSTLRLLHGELRLSGICLLSTSLWLTAALIIIIIGGAKFPPFCIPKSLHSVIFQSTDHACVSISPDLILFAHCASCRFDNSRWSSGCGTVYRQLHL